MLDSSSSESVSPPSSTATSALTRSSPGSFAPLSEERVQVLDEVAHQSVEPLQLGGRERRPHHRVRPLAEAVAVGDGDAEQLGDHRDRQRERERRDELHLAVGDDGSISPSAISWIRGRSCSIIRGVNAFETRRRRRRWSSPSRLSMLLSMKRERTPGGRLGRQLLRRQREPRVADEALVVEQHRLRVVVARHEPDRRLAVDPGLAEDGVVLAHLREGRVRVGAERVAVEVVLARGRRHAGDATPGVTLHRRWTQPRSAT